MIEKVLVHGHGPVVDRQRRGRQPVGVGVTGRVGLRPLAQEQDVGHNGGALGLEGVRRQANGPEEVGLFGESFAGGGVLLVEREVGGDDRQHPAGAQGVERLGQEVIVQRQLLALLVGLHVGERNVANNGINCR